MADMMSITITGTVLIIRFVWGLTRGSRFEYMQVNEQPEEHVLAIRQSSVFNMLVRVTFTHQIRVTGTPDPGKRFIVCTFTAFGASTFPSSCTYFLRIIPTFSRQRAMPAHWVP